MMIETKEFSYSHELPEQLKNQLSGRIRFFILSALNDHKQLTSDQLLVGLYRAHGITLTEDEMFRHLALLLNFDHIEHTSRTGVYEITDFAAKWIEEPEIKNSQYWFR